jgi:hypothetical protein
MDAKTQQIVDDMLYEKDIKTIQEAIAKNFPDRSLIWGSVYRLMDRWDCGRFVAVEKVRSGDYEPPK